jgi:hypothetical protein
MYTAYPDKLSPPGRCDNIAHPTTRLEESGPAFEAAAASLVSDIELVLLANIAGEGNI